MTDKEQQAEQTGSSEAKRETQLMGRLQDIILEEFPDLSPPRVVFVLGWLQHRYYDEIEQIISERMEQSKPGKPEGVPIVCRI